MLSLRRYAAGVISLCLRCLYDEKKLVFGSHTVAASRSVSGLSRSRF